MNAPKSILLILALAFVSPPLILASVEADAATTKRVKKTKKTKTKKAKHVLKKKSKKTKKKKKVVRSTAARTTTRATTRRTQRAHRGSRTVVRRTSTRHHRTGVHVDSSHHQTTHRSRRVVRNRRPASRTYYARDRHPETEVASTGHSHGKSSMTAALRGGIGTGSLLIPRVASDTMGSMNLFAEIGVKGKLFGFDFGVNGGNYFFEDENALRIWGLNMGLRLQPKFGIVEPFATIGTGFYWLDDSKLNEIALSGALNVGVGAEIHINDVALGLKYQWSRYSFSNDESYDGILATNNSIMGTVSLFF